MPVDMPPAEIGPLPPLPNTFREKIVMGQGVVMIILVAALVFLVVRLTSVQGSNACNISRAAAAAAVQQTRISFGNEGRAAATALANSVIAAADSPSGVQRELIVTAEKTYATVSVGVNAGLSDNPVVPVVAC